MLVMGKVREMEAQEHKKCGPSVHAPPLLQDESRHRPASGLRVNMSNEMSCTSAADKAAAPEGEALGNERTPS